MYKNNTSFWNRFLLLLAFIICTCMSALLLFITVFFFFKVNITLKGLSGKIVSRGS